MAAPRRPPEETRAALLASLAVSVLAGAFGLASGDSAGADAVAVCAAKNKLATDCVVVVEK